MQRGFIQIPFLIAILIGIVVLGGTGYVAYEVGQKSPQNASEPVAATTTATNNSSATTTDDADDQLTEFELLKNEVENLKKTGTPVPIKTALPPAQPVQTQAQNKNVASVSDYKQQTTAILNGAKDNLVRIQSFSKNSTGFIKKEKDFLQQFANAIPLNTGSTLDETYGLLYDYCLSSIKVLSEKQVYFETTAPNILQNEINQINQTIASIQSDTKPVSFDTMQSFQITYFSTNRFENYLGAIQDAQNSTKEKISEIDNFIGLVLDKVRAYIDQNTSSYSSPVQYTSPIITLPSLPQTTRCTISGDGGVGLQAYVNCTTGSF
ncbi:MAG: hypothetical protein COW88_00440 [Candidatus Lloydbacteria bacterium CG22_combo_CG10-13_8_21_14_all_47_15]|uniref:Uncharacterized protein n=1 Tax=Candidatus Lloydbacteria bacterium CG22_combo_CG10-13_8_21_14_all_47_15 TaxID=1974635 RepID=A0A2H0CVI2_9BACT|nr:MAG: hypothetical protein COW88_00440 [Candidatus Lloydbacteria bacterium CG22_combo_CG10-13_8_21_14_all_47_15]